MNVVAKYSVAPGQRADLTGNLWQRPHFEHLLGARSRVRKELGFNSGLKCSWNKSLLWVSADVESVSGESEGLVH